MTKPFWIKYVPKDQTTLTQGLSVSAKGAYFCLFNACFSNGGFIVDDNQRLARMVGVRIDEWADLREELEHVFIIDHRGWHNPDLLAEMHATERKIDARKAAGRKGGAAKAMNGKTNKASKIYHIESESDLH